MTIKRQLNLSYSVAFFLLVGAIFAGVSVLSYQAMYRQAMANMDGLVTNTRNLLEMDFSNVVTNYLKGMAERDLDLCQKMVEDCFASADYIEGRTAFMEKRKPAFKGK